MAPTNANITIRNKSPGDDGAVSQINTSQSTAGAANSNDATQDAAQVQDGAGGSNERSILGGNGSPHTYIPRGHTSYPPTPSQPASAGTTQPANTSQSQTAMQSAPTTQSGNATATSVQGAPANGDVTVSVDGAATDPGGSGRQGMLIQIWIPLDGGTSPAANGGTATQTNGSSADARAANSNQTTQNAAQQQTAPSDGDSQLGGVGQTQIIRQSAPTTQVGTAGATSDQSGAANLAAGGSAVQTNISSAKAAVDNSNQTTQTAQQIQDGGGAAGGSQVQVIEQSAPTGQIATVQATSDQTGVTNAGNDGWAVQTNISSSSALAGKSNQIVQTAAQIQTGPGEGERQVQVVEQSGPTTNRVVAQGCKRPCSTGGSASDALGGISPSWSSAAGGDTPGPTKSSGAAKKSDQRPQRDRRLPPDPKVPGAASGNGSGDGGSLWVFAALLIPFALTAPWWARRHGPSTLRRLTGVVVRPERPG